MNHEERIKENVIIPVMQQLKELQLEGRVYFGLRATKEKSSKIICCEQYVWQNPISFKKTG